MSMEYIRKTYKVPAKPGGRVEYTGSGKPEYGTIKSADGAHLSILLDGEKLTRKFHPTWEMRYLPDNRAISDCHLALGITEPQEGRKL